MKSFLLLMAVFVLGCGKAPDMPEYYYSGNLSAKSMDEVVAIKYTGPFILNCAIRTFNDNVIKTMNDPIDSFDWELTGDFSLKRVLHYRVGDQKMVVVVKIAEVPKIVPFVNVTTETKKEYYMENSPVLKIKYRRAPGRILLDGTIHDENAYKEVTLYENVDERIFSIASEVDEDIVTDDLRCTLKTGIKPVYSKEWQQLK